jgi:hypothetical protein
LQPSLQRTTWWPLDHFFLLGDLVATKLFNVGLHGRTLWPLDFQARKKNDLVATNHPL